MDSEELSGWAALMKVQHEEAEHEQEMARHRAESKDGDVITYGTPRVEGTDDDGEAE